MDEPEVKRKRGVLDRVLDRLERLGNGLPDPITLFALLAVLVVIASWIAARMGVQVPHPRDGTPLLAVDLLSHANVQRMFTDAVKNFTGFAPLGLVLVAMIGMGVAEGSGLVATALRGFVLRIPRALLTPAIILAGIFAHLAADAGIVVLPPLAGLVYLGAGRNPIAGIAAAFAGVAGGFSANLLPAPLDAVLAGLSQSALDANKLLPGYHVQILGNWFFLAASSVLIVAVGTFVTDRVIEPRLGPWKGDASPLQVPTATERKGLVVAAVATLICLAGFALLVRSPGSPLRDPAVQGLDSWKPFLDSIVILVTILFLVPGIAYGLVTGSIRSDRDVAKLAGAAMNTMGTYIVLAFVAAQFVNWFAWSNLAVIIAVRGAHFLRDLGLSGAALMGGLVLVTAFLNLFTSSASAKWATFAPVFVPMFLLLGFSPEGTQVIYRIGDSATNIITPLMPYMPFILTYIRKYDPKAGMGTIISLMMPFSLAFLTTWLGLLLIWDAFGWPIGPGVGLHLH